MRCQHRGCSNLARYGPLDSPPRACQLHKRVGQFTTDRHGALFRATREGNAFRELAAATVKSPPPCSIFKGSSGRSSSSSHPMPGRTSATRGCEARPDYGLPGATRAVYCFSHKKGPMVQLFKEPPSLPNKAGQAESAAAPVVTRKATTGKRSQGPAAAAAAAAASVGAKKTRAPSDIDRNGSKKARRGQQETEEDNDADVSGTHRSKKRRSGGKDERGAISSAQVTKENLTKTTAKTSAPSLPSPAPAAEANPPSSPNNRLADSSGMAPSVEFLVLRQAREDAKTEAEASGLGRRPRAPSRRALEAAGRLKGTGAQWMSREKKAEDLRVKAELRQQRKQYQKVSPEALSAPYSKQHGTGQRKETSVGRGQKPSKQARSTAVAESG
ncbi:expressed unknown protein [Ectocarpus siliculosus]|uniref:Uncharacterized protein n=1 Tax=Ectocarpus siliculosus TaxID=2880 RepID=D7G0U7_ECTSI|nr:expressed unknown protein [Ectocarpus siliculosus]|eukprot:CBJ26691.1 expressed unknown protein [Ectocarpus siliculosus]